ncbi:MAG: Mur ligase family protein [Candidatus Manganitrophus sp.]|nr:MAG: Mur ligase family protein [Candidatus Manganitrophus sp.]
MWSVEEITIGSGGERRGNASVEVTGVSIDTRTLRPGDLFVAVKGPRFDGHDFVAQALEQGASGAIVSRPEFQAREEAWGPLLDRHFLTLVDDPLTALQALATWHRMRFDVPLIGVTGSNGKTTTKEMMAAILSRRGPVLKTEGNLNNHLGLPLSLLRLDAGHRAAVLEIGISLKGEMRRLCEIARPTVGLITNIGPAHLEFLGSIEGVAEEKGSLFEAVRSDGTAIINLNDPHLAPWENRFSNNLGNKAPRPEMDLCARCAGRCDGDRDPARGGGNRFSPDASPDRGGGENSSCDLGAASGGERARRGRGRLRVGIPAGGDSRGARRLSAGGAPGGGAGGGGKNDPPRCL